jgi:hypothetical protein
MTDAGNVSNSKRMLVKRGADEIGPFSDDKGVGGSRQKVVISYGVSDEVLARPASLG